MMALYDLSKPGLVALENSQKEVYFFYSANILNYLSRLIDNNTKFKHFTIAILENWYHPCDSQIVLPKYYKEYRNRGWTILNPNTRLLRYKPFIETVTEDCVHVYLITRYRKRRLVAKFNHVTKAQDWLDKYYSGEYYNIETNL